MENKKVGKDVLNEILEIIFDLNLKQGDSPYIAMKEACDKGGIKYPSKLQYAQIRAARDFMDIKKDDLLTFDRFDLELKDSEIYSFVWVSKVAKKRLEGWGIYNKTWDTITLTSDDERLDELVFELSEIVITGRMIKVTKSIKCEEVGKNGR